MPAVGLCKSSYYLREYSVELLIEYLSTRLISELAINYMAVQNKRIPGLSFNFVLQEQFQISQNNARNAYQARNYNLQMHIWDESWK